MPYLHFEVIKMQLMLVLALFNCVFSNLELLMSVHTYILYFKL